MGFYFSAYHMRPKFYDSPTYSAACYLLATGRQGSQVLNGACVVFSYSSDGEVDQQVLDQWKNRQQTRIGLWGLVWKLCRRHGNDQTQSYGSGD